MSKNVPSGRLTDYNPDFHPTDCIRMGNEGKFACDMVTEWGIHPDTLHEWRKVHPIFSEAYARAQAARASWLITTMRDNLVSSKERQLNSHAMAMMLRYDGSNPDERNVRVPGLAKCKTATAKFECLMDAFESGQITAKEASTVSDVIKKQLDATQIAEMKIQLDEITEKLNA